MPAKKPKPQPTRMVSFRIEERTKKALDLAAKADRRTTTSLVNLILCEWLKEKV